MTNAFTGIVVGGGVGFIVGVAAALFLDIKNGNSNAAIPVSVAGTCVGAGVGYYLATTK